jgi:hypothetical protein
MDVFPLLSGVLAQLPFIGTKVVMMDSLVDYDLSAMAAGQNPTNVAISLDVGTGWLAVALQHARFVSSGPGPIDPCRRQRAIVPFEDTINSFAIIFSLLLCSILAALDDRRHSNTFTRVAMYKR